VRLPQAKIREALLHPEELIREEALLYFGPCRSPDTEVMPLVIKAIETYGRDKAFRYLHYLLRLAQTQTTVDWAIQELNRKEDESFFHDSYFPQLSRLFCAADVQLLLPRAEQVLQAPGFDSSLSEAFKERLELFSWSAEQCWQELERLSAEARGDDEEVDLDRADRLVEALARRADPLQGRILETLARKVEDFNSDPLAYMETFLVWLAGEMRLEQAVPLLVQKLRENDDGLSPDCSDALAMIGTDAVVQAVVEGWLKTPLEYRLGGCTILERAHTDTTVLQCLQLMPQEEDRAIKTMLADALLSQFADEGIEPVRDMVLKKAYDPMTADLKQKLVAVSTVRCVSFPEFAAWKRETELKRADQEPRQNEMFTFRDISPQPRTLPRTEQPDMRERNAIPFQRTEKSVGRNDPCPCGSGKKFKKCCLLQRS
jgi:hypothetical protein